MSRGMFIPLVLLAEVSGLAGIALMVTWLAKYLGGFAWDGFNAQFNLHPLLMTIAMLFINGNGKSVGTIDLKTRFRTNNFLLSFNV